MEQLEKQFITSFQSVLLKEGKEICEQILAMIGEKDEMVLEKVRVFAEFFMTYKLDGVYTDELIERCKSYLDELENLHKYKLTFKRSNEYRK